MRVERTFAWEDTFKSEQQPLERIFPRKSPLDTHASRMDRRVEQPLAPTPGGVAMPPMLFEVGEHTRIEDHLPLVRSIKAAIEVEGGAFEGHTDLFGHAFHCLQSIREEHHIRCMHGSHGNGSSHRAMMVDDGNALLALLVF